MRLTLSQPTIICEKCHGWGFLGSESTKCSDCAGLGVYSMEDGKRLGFAIPTFADFKSRERDKIIKIIVFSIIAACILIIIFALLVIIYQLF